MNYAGIKYTDIANGLGCRTVLFVSGCRNKCKDCFQPHTWDFNYGAPFDEKVQQDILDSLKPDYVQGLTLLGGEPFEPENQVELVKFVRKVREQYPKKDIWAFRWMSAVHGPLTLCLARTSLSTMIWRRHGSTRPTAHSRQVFPPCTATPANCSMAASPAEPVSRKALS